MQTLEKIKPWGEAALALIYPESCAHCYGHLPLVEPHMLCRPCFESLRRIEPPYCQRCSEPFAGAITGDFECSNCAGRPWALDFAVCAYQATGAVRDLIHQFKYDHHYQLRAVLAWLASHACSEPRIAAHDDWILAPVPLHRRRFREREFNQSAELAAVLHKLTGWKVWDCLRRTRYTTAQAHLKRDARMKNLRGAFRLKWGFRRSARLAGRRVLIIDDVFTTGATTQECATVLKSHGAATVAAFTVARG